jgi:hypothetical protein
MATRAPLDSKRKDKVSDAVQQARDIMPSVTFFASFDSGSPPSSTIIQRTDRVMFLMIVNGEIGAKLVISGVAGGPATLIPGQRTIFLVPKGSSVTYVADSPIAFNVYVYIP